MACERAEGGRILKRGRYKVTVRVSVRGRCFVITRLKVRLMGRVQKRISH